MAWFVTLASKMTGKEIPGVGMAPGGKIKKPKEEVEVHLQHFLALADAMAKNKNWNYLAQYSILKVPLSEHTKFTRPSSFTPLMKTKGCGCLFFFKIAWKKGPEAARITL